MITILIIAVCVLFAFVVTLVVTQEFMSAAIVAVICTILGGLTFYPVAGLTGGFFANYSNGQRIGFVTKATTKGIVFRTNEIDMQMGSGQQASLSPHFECSVPNQQTFDQIQGKLGEEVKITYREWLIMPWWMGKSGYEVTKVEWIKK
jgi:hypothetical protein